MKLLLDTHIFLWWNLDSTKLTSTYQKLLEHAENKQEKIYLSVISLWEIAKLISLKKIEISFSLDQWFKELEEHSWIQILPLNASIILGSVRLGEDFHKDPADQLIVSTALYFGMHLMTQDERIRKASIVALA